MCRGENPTLVPTNQGSEPGRGYVADAAIRPAKSEYSHVCSVDGLRNLAWAEQPSKVGSEVGITRTFSVR